MNKLTIFFIVTTVSVVLILGGLLGYRYFTQDEPVTDTPKGAIAMEEDKKPTEPAEPAGPAEEPTPEPVEAEKKVFTDTSTPPPSIPSPFASQPQPEPELPSFDRIDVEKVNIAGFTDNDLRVLTFDGIVFNDFDISEYDDDDHVFYIISKDVEESAKIAELVFPEGSIADEVYASLKEKMEISDIFSVNQTNQYGDASFFANNSEQKNLVFLVVKIGERLYTLHYPAKNHNKIKNLINLL